MIRPARPKATKHDASRVPAYGGGGNFGLETSNAANPFTRDDLETAAAAAVLLAGALRHALRIERLRRKADLLEEELRMPLAGVGEAFETLLGDVAAAAEDALPVLIVGESGVGKEQVAREIHRRGDSAGGPFAVFLCGSGRDEEAADCLFGRGSRPGRIERAFDGVLFLDRIERLDPASRSRLIEVLDRREYARPGGGPLVRVYARLMASATEEPGEGEAAVALDPELYHRLAAHLIHVPPLRERREDIPAIAEAVIGPREFSPDARRALLGYEWPCNARELRNALLRAARARPRGRIELEDLPDAVVESAADSSKPFGYHAGVQQAKRRLILDALRQAGGRHQDAAAILGINRTYLHRLIRTLNLKDEIERATAAGE